jgi:hypothetical protein
LIGRTGIHHTSRQQTDAIVANPVRAAWIFDLRADWNTLTTQADCVLATIGVVVDLAVTVVVLAIANLGGLAHAAHADPAAHALAVEMPWLAFTLQGSAGVQARRIAGIARRDDILIHPTVAVVVLSITGFGRGPYIVNTHDLPGGTDAHALSTFAHSAATGDADPVRLVVGV